MLKSDMLDVKLILHYNRLPPEEDYVETETPKVNVATAMLGKAKIGVMVLGKE